MIPVLGLLPVVRFHDELIEGDVSRHTHHHPIERDEQDPLDERIFPASQTSNQVNIDVKEIAKDETKGSHVENRAGEKDAVELDWAKHQVERRQGPHEGIDEEHDRPGTYNELQGGKLAELTSP